MFCYFYLRGYVCVNECMSPCFIIPGAWKRALDPWNWIYRRLQALGASAGGNLTPVPLGFVCTDSIIPAWETLGEREGNERDKKTTGRHAMGD